MIDSNAIDARWTLLLGLPVIAWLMLLARRRTQKLIARIQEVRMEMARSPQDPYLALSGLMAEPDEKKQGGRHGKRRD